jgi:hypothetical protein
LLLAAGTPQPPVSTASTSIPHRIFPHSNGAHSIIYPYPNPNLVLDRANILYSINVRFGQQAYTRLDTPVETLVVIGTPLLGPRQIYHTANSTACPPHTLFCARGSRVQRALALRSAKGAATPEFWGSSLEYLVLTYLASRASQTRPATFQGRPFHKARSAAFGLVCPTL